MPALDMPLESLKKYMGINPRPDDFDEFWDNSLKELDAIPFDAEFTPYDLPSNVVDFYELRFTSTKGARIYAKFARPKNINGKIPAVLLFHGLSGRSCDWSELVRYAAEGFAIAALDTRGQGGYSEDVGGVPGTTYTTPLVRGLDGKPEDFYCRDIFLDTAQLARLVMSLEYVDRTRVAVFGGSQGGALSISCAALVPEIKLCCPMYPYLCDYKRVWEMDLDVNAYEGIRYYLRFFDPRHEHVDEFFTKLGYIDLQFLAPRIKAKFFMGTGLLDNICPPSTQFAAYNKITSEKEVVIYPDFKHENLCGHQDLIYKFILENI